MKLPASRVWKEGATLAHSRSTPQYLYPGNCQEGQIRTASSTTAPDPAHASRTQAESPSRPPEPRCRNTSVVVTGTIGGVGDRQPGRPPTLPGDAPPPPGHQDQQKPPTDSHKGDKRTQTATPCLKQRRNRCRACESSKHFMAHNIPKTLRNLRWPTSDTDAIPTSRTGTTELRHPTRRDAGRSTRAIHTLLTEQVLHPNFVPALSSAQPAQPPALN